MERSRSRRGLSGWGGGSNSIYSDARVLADDMVVAVLVGVQSDSRISNRAKDVTSIFFLFQDV